LPDLPPDAVASVAHELAGALQAAMLATGQPPTLEAIVYPASTALDQRPG